MRAEPGTGTQLMADKARHHAELEARLAEIEPRVVANGDPFQLSVLRYGIELNRWSADWWTQRARV
jgi:hypothetical protein